MSGYSIFSIREVIFEKRIGLYENKLLFPEPKGFLLSCVSLIHILWSKKSFLCLTRGLESVPQPVSARRSASETIYP